MRRNYRPLKETVEPGVFTTWQQVDVEIVSFTDLGIKVTVNDEYVGLVYGDQVYDDYRVGERLQAFIQQVREDGKIDVSFQPKKDVHVFETAGKIMAHLREAGGYSSFCDKSRPDDIEYEFQVSKSVFKQAIGKLYKQGKIKLIPNGIELVN